jgi:hypothetical protein
MKPLWFFLNQNKSIYLHYYILSNCDYYDSKKIFNCMSSPSVVEKQLLPYLLKKYKQLNFQYQQNSNHKRHNEQNGKMIFLLLKRNLRKK